MYAEVLLNHNYSRQQERFTYKVPDGMDLKCGSGVVVPFQRGQKAGVVLGLSPQEPSFKSKDIAQLIEPGILLWDWQIELAEWISEYYFCSQFDSVRLMLPKHIWRVPKQSRSTAKKEKKWTSKAMHTLTDAQDAIVEAMKASTKPNLLHGITGAGKTEVYKHLIQHHIEQGKQALLLVPEIALTPQLVKEFEGHFQHIAVLHSRVSEGKRAEHWKNIHAGTTQLVIGSRSALFSPFKNLGVIVMDEEHEWTYKQEQSPRYHAKDAALKTCELTGAQFVAGSATPSVESMYKAQSGEWNYHHLPQRIQGTPLPKVDVVDMCRELHAKNYSVLSHRLEQKIRSTLAAGEQVILFLNRRGSASSTLCRDCGEVLSCDHCDVKLTYHRQTMRNQVLICHHCGRVAPLPETCPNCSSHRIKHLGVGTEKVESELRALFPEARIHRADRDTMSQKNSFKDLHKALNAHEIDILIGTQMIAKGLDIPSVSLVGVILADLGMHIPDFRASERSFQLLTQVAGRAGRRDTQGHVVIQTYNPDHPAVRFSQEHDYLSFYEQEISEREAAQLPPYSKLVKCMFQDKDKAKCMAAAKTLEEALKGKEHLIFMAPALIPRINGVYRWQVLIQGENPRGLIQSLPKELLEQWRIDVDPIHSV